MFEMKTKKNMLLEMECT